MPTQTVFQGTVELLDYQQFLDYAANQLEYDGQTQLLQHIDAKLRANPFNSQSSLTTQEQWAQQIMHELQDNGFDIQYNGNNQWTGSVFSTTPQTTVTNPVNSNVSQTFRGKIRNFYGGINEFNSGTGMQTWVPQRFPVSGGLGNKAMYVLSSVGQALTAVSVGTWLGKTIDSALYNAMPDYWDSIGMSTLNPETWNGMVNSNDSPFAGLFNMILGIDGEHSTAKAYMNQDALAYMAYALSQNGWFSSGNEISQSTYLPSGITSIPFNPFYIGTCTFGTYNIYRSNGEIYTTVTGYAFSANGYTYIFYSADAQAVDKMIVFAYPSGNNYIIKRVATSNAGTLSSYIIADALMVRVSSGSTGGGGGLVTYDNRSCYAYVNISSSNATANLIFSSILSTPSVGTINIQQASWIAYYGDVISNAPEGVSNQPNATLPDTSTWNDIPSTLQSLQQQYPDAFNNPMVWNIDTPFQNDTGHQATYIPVPFPMANSATDTMPISGTQLQNTTQVGDYPQAIQKLLTDTVQQTSTQPATPPQNPVDTGTGGTPTPVGPVGSASALWSVYHPTQAQINSFGAWLWGSVFTTDIRKLFEDPIQGVISLHKIFAPPVDSGSGNIVVGTLDSGVGSATVTQQYVTVDCGSVSCNEDFGNVFDYAPFTSVSLFLPFIGIVPLDVSDVMRSTIHVVYGVDVFTGACLAMVEVSRDGNTVNMYQYSGVASVEYPLTNMQQSGILSGLLSVAGGVAMTVASGGVGFAAGAAMVGGAAQAANTHIGRSGGFSGNAGAMGIKKPYLIIVRPQTKVASTFPLLEGYPTNYSCKLGECTNHVVVTHVHVEGINATDTELSQIESMLKEGVLV